MVNVHRLHGSQQSLSKDPYTFPRIDLLMDSTAGCRLFIMMDAYQGAAYQRLVNRMFKELIGVSMEVNVDDMLVKSRRSDDHLIHLKQAFEVMRTNGMKLNPTKCTFGVGGSKFPDYLVRERGIEANPGKIEAIMKLVPPKTIKEIQRLTGKITTLNRFISRSTDQNLPFFKTLRKTKDFEWNEECEQALQGEFDIEYQARVAVKAQVLANFVLELTGDQTLEEQEGETPFRLVYGTEAIIPTEIGEETQRIAGHGPKNCRAERAFDLIRIEEKRDQTYAKILHQKGLMMKSYNHKVKPRHFQVGDLVLKNVEGSKCSQA
ncbi:UNVERIFIED_CONTAM: hypothetical protein Scaly_2993600 [Sesamum calycinum]|uniref:Reverse transcriptase domain-containing protein n=1 Tax=Sesamum calycinum TaxID=2727403 RepID=A0AAW2KFB9_9LAMI